MSENYNLYFGDVQKVQFKVEDVGPMDKFVKRLKSIYFLSSTLTLIIVVALGILDFIVFVDQFNFSVAMYKDFYLPAINPTLLEFFLIIAISPLLIALLLVAIPFMVVYLSDKCIIDKSSFLEKSRNAMLHENKKDDFNMIISFYMLYLVNISLSLFLLLLLIDIDNIQLWMIFVIIIFSIIPTLLLSIVDLKNSNKLLIFVVSIIIGCILYYLNCIDNYFLIILIALVLMSLPLPYIIYYSLILIHQKKESKDFFSFSSLIIAFFLVYIALFLVFMNMNGKSWSNFNSQQNNFIAKSTFNLLLNRAFMRPLYNVIEVNTTTIDMKSSIEELQVSEFTRVKMNSFVKNNKICFRRKSSDENRSLEILSLSQEYKLLFETVAIDSNKSAKDVVIFALKVVNVKGVDKYILKGMSGFNIANE